MKATTEFKNKFYYHGTNNVKCSKGIIESKCLMPGRSTYSGAYTPLDGMVYITPDPRLAIIYAFGYTTLEEWDGIQDSEFLFDDYNPYICTINGKHLRDIRPDEDFMAFILYEYFEVQYMKDNRHADTPEELDNMTDEHWEVAKEYINTNSVFSRNDVRKYSKGFGNNLFEFCLGKAKKWINSMKDSEIEFWLRTGCSIAHKGNLAIEEMRMIEWFDPSVNPLEIINISEIIMKR